MSIRARIVVAVTFQKVDDAPCAEAGAQSYNQDFQGINRTCKKSHKVSSFNLRNHVFVVWPFQARNEKTPLCFKKIYIKHRGGMVQDIPEKVFSCQGRSANPQKNLLPVKRKSPSKSETLTSSYIIIRPVPPNPPP